MYPELNYSTPLNAYIHHINPMSNGWVAASGRGVWMTVFCVVYTYKVKALKYPHLAVLQSVVIAETIIISSR